MDKSDAILAIVSAAGSSIQGRTTLQKLAYFGTAKGLLEAHFKAHFYGPYSTEIADTIESLVSLGFLKEGSNILGPQTDPWLAEVSGEVKTYTYELTDDGKQLVAEIKKQKKEEWEGIREVVESAKKYSNLSPGILSIAAKVHFMIRDMGRKPVTLDRLVAEAEKHNWDLSEDKIQKAAGLLMRLEP
jgi:uncharacterized protein YwgA